MAREGEKGHASVETAGHTQAPLADADWPARLDTGERSTSDHFPLAKTVNYRDTYIYTSIPLDSDLYDVQDAGRTRIEDRYR